MALVTCRECGTEVSDLAPSCVKCGAPRPRPTPPKPPPSNQSARWLLGTAAVIAVLLWLAPGPTPEERAASDAQFLAKRTIDACWEAQGRKSLSPGTQRFVAGACEMAEEDYRSKYGRYYKKDGQTP